MLKRKTHTFSVGPKKIKLENVNTLPENATIVLQENGEQVATVYQDDGTGVPIGGTVISSDGTEMLHFAPSEHTIIEEVPMDPEVGEQVFYGEASNIIVEATDDQQHLLEGADEEGALHVALDDDLEQQVVETEQLPLETQIEHVSVEDVGAQDVTSLEEDYESADTPPYQNIIVQHMDISEPLTTLRKLLEQRLHCSLSDHEFYLQDTLPLDANKSLVQQRVDGSGMVQVNIEVKSQPGIRPILNIVDILKPAEEMEVHATPEVEKPVSPIPNTSKVIIPFPEEAANVTRWIVDQNFRKEQDRLKIPFDPELWSEVHVRHWIQWAIKEFNLKGVNLNNFVSGRQLCEMKHDEFIKLIPSDKGDIFWTHLELLRKCKFVAVIQQPTPHAITTITVSTSDTSFDGRGGKTYARQRGRCITLPGSASGNRTGNNGQIQLWQFLLELLTDKDCQEIIHWVGDEGEFKLSNQEMVAQLWGQRKNKPTMNYEKLSRALRYYYDGDMIAKVHGKRFVYKFVCDLRTLLGYSAAELNHLVSECAERKHNCIPIHQTPQVPIHQRPQVHNIFRKRTMDLQTPGLN